MEWDWCNYSNSHIYYQTSFRQLHPTSNEWFLASFLHSIKVNPKSKIIFWIGARSTCGAGSNCLSFILMTIAVWKYIRMGHHGLLLGAPSNIACALSNLSEVTKISFTWILKTLSLISFALFVHASAITQLLPPLSLGYRCRVVIIVNLHWLPLGCLHHRRAFSPWR